MPSPVFRSRSPVGSSARISVGSVTMARAMPTRCCSPPESCRGRCLARCSSPTSASAVATCALRCGARERREQQRQLDVLRRRQHRQQVVELEDQPDVAGPPAGELPPSESWSMRWPATSTLPAVGRSRPAIRLSSVLLPEPDGPHQGEELAAAEVEVEAAQHLAPPRRRGGTCFSTPRRRASVAEASAGDKPAGAAAREQAGDWLRHGWLPFRRGGDAHAVAVLQCRRPFDHHPLAGGEAGQRPSPARRRSRRPAPRGVRARLRPSPPARRPARHPGAAPPSAPSPRALPARPSPPRFDERHLDSHVGEDARVAGVEADAHLHRRLLAVGGGDRW